MSKKPACNGRFFGSSYRYAGNEESPLRSYELERVMRLNSELSLRGYYSVEYNAAMMISTPMLIAALDRCSAASFAEPL